LKLILNAKSQWHLKQQTHSDMFLHWLTDYNQCESLATRWLKVCLIMYSMLSYWGGYNVVTGL